MRYFFLSFALCLTACQTTPALSPDQRRTLQTRIFKPASYNTVFRAFKTVMQDEGYVIKNMDMDGGFLVAETQKSMGAGYNTLVILGALGGNGGTNYATGRTYTCTVNLEEIQKDVVEARLIFQRTTNYSRGGKAGGELLKPEVYQNLFAKVFREVERRKALKRK
ncbi:MAG: hypothetical protein OXK80_02060 [Bdellovibrionales bacterium]|nr:hypothetical protein [Bdellovibrionales bacterium]